MIRITNNKNKRTWFRLWIAGLILLLGGSIGLMRSSTVQASSGSILLSTDKSVVKQGDVFTVVCRVSASTGVLEADFYVDYNTAVLQFVEGGQKAKKEVGGVHIQSLDNTSSPARRTFSLQFIAKELGDATVFIRNGARVMDGEGDPLSLSTGRLELQVTETGESDDEPGPGQQPPDASQIPAPGEGVPPQPSAKLSNNCKIKELVTNADKLTPEFDPTVGSYEAEVPADTQTFFIDYTLASKKAKAKIKGNRDLTFGVNKVTLTVTAESGKKKKYVFMVKRRQEPAVGTTDTVSGAAVNEQPPLDKEENKGYSIIVYVILAVLVVFAVAMVLLVKKQQRELQYYYEKEELEEKRETENDRGSGESDHEGREVRGEDGEFRYRN
ncbi:MAG: cadherin-like beta sandwich domain-containing protein [Eubacterium sp.]|nr:cadherin-like beta sandwich domain-containing protein [Eubacterium sp.]